MLLAEGVGGELFARTIGGGSCRFFARAIDGRFHIAAVCKHLQVEAPEDAAGSSGFSCLPESPSGGSCRMVAEAGGGGMIVTATSKTV